MGNVLENLSAAHIRLSVKKSEFTQRVINRMSLYNEHARMIASGDDEEDDAGKLYWRTNDDVLRCSKYKMYHDLFFNDQESWLRPTWLKEGKSKYKRYNLCRFVTRTFTDLILGKGVKIDTGDKVIDDYIKDVAKVPISLYKWFQMASIHGFVALQVVADEQGVDIIPVDSDTIYPEFDESGIDYKSISKKVFVQPNEVFDPSGSWDWDKHTDQNQDRGIVFEEKHFKGFIQYFLYVVEGNEIVETLPVWWYNPFLPELNENSVSQVETDVPEFMLMIVPNELLMKRFVSDYDDIVDQQEGINSRNTQSSRVLNVHADPKLMLPDSMQQRDPYTGATILRGLRDEVLFIGPEENAIFKPEYLTWSAQLEEGQREIMFDLNMFLTLTQISSVFIEKEGSMFPESAAALKMRLTPTLNRASVKQADFTLYLKRILWVFVKKLQEFKAFERPPVEASDEDPMELMDQMARDGVQEGVESSNVTDIDLGVNGQVPEPSSVFDVTTFRPDDIKITYKPAIPQDDHFLQERTGNKPTASRQRVLEEVDGMTEQQALEELSLIDSDNKGQDENAFGGAGLQFGSPEIPAVPKDLTFGGTEDFDGGLNRPKSLAALGSGVG